jgi:predicted kinase
MTERTYRSLLEDAEAALRAGRSVVVDASFARRAQRKPFADLAQPLQTPLLVVETAAPEETIGRMAARARDFGEVSDADRRLSPVCVRRHSRPTSSRISSRCRQGRERHQRR